MFKKNFDARDIPKIQRKMLPLLLYILTLLMQEDDTKFVAYA